MATPPKPDDRPYIKLEHSMPENPKVVGLSDGAFRLYIEALCWCSRQGSDGDISFGVVRRLAAQKVCNELVSAGLFLKGQNGYSIHDYLAHQRSAAEIASYRNAKAEQGQKGAHMRWHVPQRRFDEKCDYCQGVLHIDDA